MTWAGASAVSEKVTTREAIAYKKKLSLNFNLKLSFFGINLKPKMSDLGA